MNCHLDKVTDIIFWFWNSQTGYKNWSTKVLLYHYAYCNIQLLQKIKKHAKPNSQIKKIKALVIFCWLSTITFLVAQTYTKRQEFTVTNPNSYEMTKFGLIPLNQYTGKANVSFPLFSLNLDGKEVPFTLNYDSGGVKVSQEATWVG